MGRWRIDVELLVTSPALRFKKQMIFDKSPTFECTVQRYAYIPARNRRDWQDNSIKPSTLQLHGLALLWKGRNETLKHGIAKRQWYILHQKYVLIYLQLRRLTVWYKCLYKKMGECWSSSNVARVSNFDSWNLASESEFHWFEAANRLRIGRSHTQWRDASC